MSSLLDRGGPYLAVFLGPLAWIASTNLNYTFAQFACGWSTLATALPAALVLAGISLAGAAVGWRGWRERAAEGPVDPPQTNAPRKFLAGAGTVIGTLFAAVILLQGTATLMIAGCMR